MLPIIVREDTLSDPEESARRMFDILDEQGSHGGNGTVTTKKFKDLLNLFGMKMSYEEVRELFHEYDENFDGYLDQEEFVRMMIESGVES
jgi:Ca2+-binding EF-hand superfamily protein